MINKNKSKCLILESEKGGVIVMMETHGEKWPFSAKGI